MSDTESSARNSDDSDEEVEEEEDEEEEDEEDEEEEVEEDESEEEVEVEDEDDEEEEDSDDENDDSDTNGENDGSDESNAGDHDTDESEESDSENKSTENESEEYSESDEKKMERPKASFKLKDSKKKAKIKTPVKNKSVRNESPDLKHKSDSDEDSIRDDNSESDEQQNGGKEKGLMAKIEIKESIKETEVKVQPVDSMGNESLQLQQKRDSDDEQGSKGKLKGLAHKIETEESTPEHVENKSRKIESPVLERKSDADDDSKTNSKSDEQESSVKVKDLAAKAGNKESNEETKIKAQHVESVREESLELQQKSHLATDSDGNDNSKSEQQESRKKVIGHAAKMENKESEKETEIKVQPVKSVRKESPELQRKSYSAKGSKGNDTFKSDKQEMKDIAAKTESKESKNKTKIIAAQLVKDKSNKQVMEVKVPVAKTEINESKKETKINTQPVEAESVRKQSSDQANKALLTEKKEAKKEDFLQPTGVSGTYVQVDRCDVISTRRVGTQTKLKHYNVCTFTSGLIKRVNMQTYTSGLISKSDQSTNTIQERGNDKRTQTKDKYVLERHLTGKDSDSSEKKTTDNKDPTQKSDEHENETSVQLKRRKVKVPLLKLSPEEESNSANSTESTEDGPPQPDSLSKKAKDIKSSQKLQKTPMESSGVYTDKEYDKKTRKEKENIRRRGRRRPQICNFSKRHPSREFIPQPSKNKTSHFRRPTSAGPVYKRELINPIHRPGDSKNKILLVRPNSAGPVHKRQSKQPEGTALSMAQFRMLYHHRWADIPF